LSLFKFAEYLELVVIFLIFFVLVLFCYVLHLNTLYLHTPTRFGIVFYSYFFVTFVVCASNVRFPFTFSNALMYYSFLFQHYKLNIKSKLISKRFVCRSPTV